GPIDGLFGSLTRNAVIGFQSNQSMPSTGIVDLVTWNTLVDLYGSAPPPVPDPCPSGERCDSVVLVDGCANWMRREHLGELGGLDQFMFGNPGDIPFMGDWDCDGTDSPGLYRQSDGFVYLRGTNTTGIADITFYFGNPGDVPIIGDFDADGCDTVSIYRPAEARFFIINALGEEGRGLGHADYSFEFGNRDDLPFVGDFDGDGVDTIGLHRRSTGFVYFRNSLDTGVADLSFFYGNDGDVILAGDWNGNGSDSVAVYRPSTGRLYLSFSNRSGVADRELYVGRYLTALPGPRGDGSNLVPPSDGDGGGGGTDVVHDPSQGAEQWLPLVEDVFARWGLDQEKCGTGDRAADCIGSQVDNAIIIMSCESGGDPEAVNSSSGTTGLFQHRPTYWSARVERVRSHFPEFPSDASALDPEQNVMVAALLVDESRDALIGENSLTGPWDDGPEPWGHWDGSARSSACHDPPLVSP
ncbi:MAG: peptidoglycan-binding protein, partial [Halobacteriales archaeon]|nr:peptidoglycan-binding protein [Halobacteriales archaeon]